MLTSEQLVQAFNEAGIDSPEKVANLIGYAAKLVARQQLSYALDAAIVDRDASAMASSAAVASAKDALIVMDTALAAGA